MNAVDIHSHLNLSQFDGDREAVIARMEDAGIRTITVGVDLKTSKEAVLLADTHPSLYATIGLHPADNRGETFVPEEYASLLKHPTVVAIGECGLDYYRLQGLDTESEKIRQKKEFEAQILFAKKHNLPLMLHGRPGKGTMDAYEDMLDMLRVHASETLRGNVHFFVGNTDIATAFLEINFTLSFTGVITFAPEYHSVIQMIPLSMMHAETDSPFAAPVPYRGGRAEPVHVEKIIEAIADIKKLPVEEVRETLLENAKRVFGIKV